MGTYPFYLGAFIPAVMGNPSVSTFRSICTIQSTAEVSYFCSNACFLSKLFPTLSPFGDYCKFTTPENVTF